MKKTLQRKSVYLFAVTTLMFAEALAQHPTKQASSIYGKATTSTVITGTYIHDWLITEPVLVPRKSSSSPDEQTQKAFFDNDVTLPNAAGKKLSPITFNGKIYAWKPYSSKEDVIDLDKLYPSIDYSAVYAVIEIVSDAEKPAILAVGSDDAVKVWHNGKLIHKNWVARGTTADEDVVPVQLIKGSNQFIFKVQDQTGGWGFIVRLLDKQSLNEKLVSAAAKGMIADAELVLNAGADIAAKSKSGLTPLDAAKINGRAEVVELLLKHGAKDTAVPSSEVQLDNLYNDLNTKTSPGIAVLVSRDGNILYEKGFGYANTTSKTPVTPETKFRIGSITKQFTAAAILKLQEENKLSVSDRLSTYFPDFPRANEVTIHHLLTHTSGIFSFTGKNDFLQRVVTPVTSDEVVAYFKDVPYDFNPGNEYRYNNSGYFLLGLIIEKVSGKRLDQYFRDTFFAPLHMDNSGVYSNATTLSHEALGYQKTIDAYGPALNWDMSWAGGAGALYSTVRDLYTWNEALYGGKILSAKSMDAACTPVVLNNGKVAEPNYGYGLGMSEYRGIKYIGHSGGLHGFISQLARFPDEHLTVVALTNVTPTEVEMNPNVIAQCFLWQTMKPQESFLTQASPTNLKIYVGRYDFKQNGAVMMITSEDNNLYAQLSGQSRFQIYPAGPDEFFWKVVSAKIKFVKNETGEVTGGQFEQGGFKLEVPKMAEEKIIMLDPALYSSYAGKFDYGNNIVVTISTAEGKLFAQATNQPMLQLFPVSETEYIVKEINCRVTFVREPDQTISKIVVDISGQKKEAPRMQ